MGWLSSIGSAISSVCSAAMNVVSTAVTAVGTVLAETATKFLEVGEEKLNKIVEVLEVIAKALGIIKPDEDTEQLGDKAMKADKKPEDFDSTNEYIDYLRTEIKSSKEALATLAPEERLARKSVGCAILAKAIEEKKSLEIPIEFWKEATRIGLNAKEMDDFLTKFKNAGIVPTDFLKYLKRELNSKEESTMDSILMQAYKDLEPNLNEKEREEKVVRLQGND